MWVFGGKRINSRDVENANNLVSAGIRTPDPWTRGELATLSCLTLILMTEHKISVYQVLILLFTNHSTVPRCQKMTNCEQFRTKCCAK